MNRNYKIQAVILRQLSLGEADRLITAFSKQQGKLRLIAKGVRRLSSRKRGHLDVFSHVNLACAGGKNLDMIIEAQTINPYQVLRQNLNRVRIAYLFAELVDQLTPENQENLAVYHLLCRSLAQLDTPAASKNIIVNFERSILEILGFGLPPTLSREALETHINSITDKPLVAKKIK